ncbi:MAG TPA: NAD(P)(+) transhydrogenase (Re/Si-specific) subunit beta [Ktedonobacteraceae bacterium]|nr:NAD(P)(+) transhydrogenase (Re/Si-specific) subunit beta [Ktedonobacteraceae bacterium]
MNDILLSAAYLAAAILFVTGLKALNSPQTARRGIFLAEIGMLLAVVGTLLHGEIIQYQWILVGLVVGSTIGALMAIFMPMTAMPQRIAISHSFGALAATLVGIVEYYQRGLTLDHGTMAALGFEVLFGSLTITGSLMAFSKLQELVKSAPVTYRFQNVSNILLFFALVGVFVFLIIRPATGVLFYSMIGAGLLLGILIVLPIGGADMPVVLSLLNSYAGLASAATGLVINNNVLLIAGALDGTSGFFLSLMMSRAMNRSFTNVLFGAVGTMKAGAQAPGKGEEARTVTRYTPEDAAYILENAQSVIIIPGYGMAVAQAQHAVQELAALLIERGATVRYAIHPVAGRMPGHMNVLLAEANVPYDLLCEPEQINDDFQGTDVTLVIGANDVVNPAARYKKDSHLYGMPILNADQAHTVMILKRSLSPGFAGEDNELFYEKQTMMVFGDAKATLTSLVQLLKKIAVAQAG